LLIKFEQIKIFRKIVIGILFIVAILPIGAYIALQNPSLQTWVARKATNVLSKKLNTEVSIGRVYYVFFNKLILNDVHILYNKKDTLLNCKKLSVSFSARDLLSNKFRFQKVHLYDGIFNLLIEEGHTSNLARVFRLSGKKSPEDTTAFRLDLVANEIKLTNFRFTYNSPTSSAVDHGEEFIDFSDLSLSDINAEIKHVRYDKDTLLADINYIRFAEKSGFTVKNMNARLMLRPNEIRFNDLYLFDGYTELKANHFSMQYASINDFKEFTRKVFMEMDLDNSYLNFITLWKFAPSLTDNRLSFYASGVVSGTVANLRTEGLKVTSESGLSFIDLDARISGLPRSAETMAFIDINNCTTTSLDIARIISTINSTKPIKAIAGLSPFVKYNFKGRLAGLLNDFVANGNLTSNIGNVYVDILLRQNKTEKGLDLQGKLRTESFNVGSLINNKSIGKLTLRSTMSALLRDQESGGSKFYIDSVFIKELEFNNYPFRNINAAGSYVNDVFNGKIICHDPNLDFLFQGIFGLSAKKDSYYDFYADIAYADLAALKIDKRDKISTVSFKTLANFTQSLKGDIIGVINVKSLDFKNSKGDYSIGDISIQSASNQNNFNISLKSSFAVATYSGNDFLTKFLDKILNTTVYKHTSALLRKKDGYTYEDKPKKYKLNVSFFDSRAISELIMPGFFISANSTLIAGVDEKNQLDIELKANRIAFRQNYSSNLLLKIRSTENGLQSSIISDKIVFSGTNLDSSKIDITARDNNVGIAINFSNKGEMQNLLNFSSNILISRSPDNISPHFGITINPSVLVFNNQKWNFAKSDIQVQDSSYTFTNFRLFDKDQELFIDGTISENISDSLNIRLKNFDIGPVNLFMHKPFNLGGNFSGVASIVDAYNNPQLLIDLKGKGVSASGKEVGDLFILSKWDNHNRHFNVSVKSNLAGRTPLDVSGTYKPKDGSLDLKAKLDNMLVTYFEPFLSDIISKTTGGVTGDLHLTGNLKKLSLKSSNAVANDVGFTVNFTKVGYILNGPLLVSEKGLRAENAIIKDRYGNTGRVNGGIYYDHFYNLGFNTSINFSNLESLNTKESDNASFYGSAFGTGSLDISGSIHKIVMDINATSNRGTVIHIPLQSTSEAAGSDLLRFVEPPKVRIFNEYGFMEVSNEQKTRKSSELDVKLKINITPDAAMMIEIDKSVGDIITGYGSGLVSLEINPSKDIFSIYGDYIIDRGHYKFVLQGLFNRDFTIQQGGNIGFNGDIFRTNLNLTASYRAKASINTLISDTSSVGNRRNVDCLIKMSGPLLNPNLSFGIDIPDLDPITKSRVDAALNTEDKVVKQVMSVLVSGSFIPDIQSSIVNNSTLLYSNATEILSNQINKIFTQLAIPLDLSFNYQPGQNGRDIFDAAVSAQLFNNKVIVNGNIGSSKYLNKSGSVVGDIDVEVKLDEKGRFRAKAFSHSADQFSNYLDYSQRSGLGLVYQEEFSSFRELLNSIFVSRKKRAQKANEREARLKGQMEIKPAEEKLIFKE